MRVTLDTNVLISGTFWTGDSFRILELLDKGKISCILSKPILDEYYRILKSDEFVEKVGNKQLIIRDVIERVINVSIIVEPKEKINIVKDDPDDDKIVECAVEGEVDFTITQDNHLLKIKEFRGIRIITPKEFLELM